MQWKSEQEIFSPKEATTTKKKHIHRIWKEEEEKDEHIQRTNNDMSWSEYCNESERTNTGGKNGIRL